MTDAIRILIADDHAVVREGLRTLISTEPGMEIVGEAADGAEAVRMAIELKPDIILLDMAMPRKTGLEAIQEIKAEDPGAHILVLTSFSEDDMVFPAIRSGALGYLLKNASPIALLSAIRNVHRGEPSMSPDIATKLMRELQRSSDLPPTEEPLTEREVEVLRLVAKGLTNQEIAETLVIGEGTVRSHVSSILSKLHLANRTQAALYALREGLAPLED
ncbi:MAG: response regulator transcription factor [Anaerolineaceae bacterium]|nr:MAG: response regulator transcription factor [Anaerolineaceae bacterium]